MLDAVTESFVSRLRGLGVVDAACDKWIIRDLEQQLNVTFPAAYKAYLILAGNGWEPLEGSQYAIEDDLAGLQRSGRGIMDRSGLKLPDDAFVFRIHQGFALHYFLLDGNEDPPVFEFVEGMPPVRRLAARFTDWVVDEMNRSHADR